MQHRGGLRPLVTEVLLVSIALRMKPRAVFIRCALGADSSKPPTHRHKDPLMANHRASDQAELPDDHFEHPDGTVYVRVDPNQFALFDERDSTLVEDPGAPS